MSLKNIVKNTVAPPQESLRDNWVIDKLLSIPKGQTIIDVGAGEMPYKPYCKNLKYVSQDFGRYTGKKLKKGIPTGRFDASSVDIISDITEIPVKDGEFDNVLCTEVFEHIPDPFSALAQMNRISKKGGTLILTAPWTSLTHFYPYFYYSGFAENFYKQNLPKFGYMIKEMYVYGNYFDWLALEYVRTPLIIWGYNNFLALVFMPFVILAIPWYILLRLCSKLFPQSRDTLAWGICVVATKMKTIKKL